jgi:hypothetical protein
MPRTLTPEEQERRDTFDRRVKGDFLLRRNRRLPDMIDAIRARWAGEAEFRVTESAGRHFLRRVA